MFRTDLSNYQCDGLIPNARMKSVGWLSATEPYPQGTVDPKLVEKLEQLAVLCPVMQMRGFHYCEFCSEEELVVTVGSQRRLLGSAEIWVPEPGGLAYAAPDMVSHYIRQHSYRPPEEFLQAVEAFQPATTSSTDLEARWLTEQLINLKP